MLAFYLVMAVVFLVLVFLNIRLHCRWRESSRLGWVNNAYVKDRLKASREAIVFNLVFAAAMGWFAYLS